MSCLWAWLGKQSVNSCNSLAFIVFLSRYFLQGTTCNGYAMVLKFWKPSRVPCWLHICRGKPKALKGLFLPDTVSYTVPWALIHCNQLSREIRDRSNKGCSGTRQASALRQSCRQHQAGKSCPFYKDRPLIGNRHSIHQKPYIIWKNMGQNKLCCKGMGKRSHHPLWKLKILPGSDPGFTPSQSHQRPPL